ncbi:cytoplasmic polyadenylation element-binding protein 2 isoform 3-T3 [Clarias gariepinus]|uniref:cytoplasmic polyadenylation element-binding protein 2 isoform X3 n=1 Tax=Clarias gariepinus TaxID=13013 RepID=UPI00234C48FB|nr:cytoplasmic polyadenylation element-binding protein 2 isoform X3 [Clarias gariepinus]
MGDYSFGLLQTASLDSSALFGAFRPSYSSLSGDLLLLPAASPPPALPRSGASAASRHNMQDVPAGVTASSRRQVASTELSDDGTGNSAPERSPPTGGENGSGPHSHSHHHHHHHHPPPHLRTDFSDYKAGQGRFSAVASLRDLERDRSEKPQPRADSECAPDGPGAQLADEALTDAAAPVSPNKVQIRMEPGSAHLAAPFTSLQHHESSAASPSLPGFGGAPWSVHTSSPPPAPPPPPPPPPGSNSVMPGTEPHGGGGGGGGGFYPGIPSPGFFQGFGHGFGAPFSPQMGGAPPQHAPSRRSPLSPQHGAFLQQRNSYNQQQPLMKQSLWGSGWNSAGVSWGRDHRGRGVGMAVPVSLGQISPMKKPFSSGSVIAPPKFPRSGVSLGPKTWSDDNVFRTDNNSNTLLPLQDRSRMYDSLNMHSLESSLIDIIRAEQDPLKARSYGRRRGRSSLFPIDDGLLDDGHGNQGVPGVLGSSGYPHQNGERIERFSRKVFVGGLPPDIDEDEITSSFRRFGHLVVDWPHKAESKSYFPPKGYAFLLFQEESSVQALIEACLEEDGKLYLCVSSPTIKDKPVQIRPWNLSDSDFVMDGSQPLDPRKTIFVGGVPRPLRAVELAMIMDRLYGGVCYAGIDTDPELKYPKGAGRVAFSNQQSYIAAISARFVQLQHGDIDKRVEVKPYVLDDQLCDECQGARCGGKFAPFFCANVTCLQYYCEFCWANIHSRAGREFHKPLVKEGADRPRQIHFRWN